VIAVTWLELQWGKLTLKSVTTPSGDTALAVFTALKTGQAGAMNVRLWAKGQLWAS